MAKQGNMESIVARINAEAASRAEQIRAAQSAVNANRKQLNDANAAAEDALVAGDESAFVVAKQKAAEAAARLEYNERRLAAIEARTEHPETREIMQSALQYALEEYRSHAARCLDLISELIAESEKAGNTIEKYCAVVNLWRTEIDSTANVPDFPNRNACNLKQNLSFAKDNLSTFLGRK